MRGRFIVIEGPDGCGKSLQSRMLAEKLQEEGHRVLLTEEPTNSDIGKYIRTVLAGEAHYDPDSVQLLFSADRADHVARVVQPAMEEGTNVICSRYTLSTIFYGAAKGADKEWLALVNAHFLQPDCLIILLPPIETCIQRLSLRPRTDVHETKELVRKTHMLYTEYAKTMPQDCVINSSKPIADSLEQVYRAVLTHASPA